MWLRCNTYSPAGARCTSPATVRLIQPDGHRNPGGYVCQPCGQATVQEYADKLGEQWQLVPLDESERVLSF